GQHAYHASSANKREIAARYQTFVHVTLKVRPTNAVTEGFWVVSMFLYVIKILSFTCPERFSAQRSMNRYDSVADVPSWLRVVQDRHAQFPTLSIRQKQRAKVTSRDAQEVRR